MPTAISLLMVIAMAGKPQKCERPDYVERTYGWELLVLPLATASPFIAGFYIARISANRKERHLRATGISTDRKERHLRATGGNGET